MSKARTRQPEYRPYDPDDTSYVRHPHPDLPEFDISGERQTKNDPESSKSDKNGQKLSRVARLVDQGREAVREVALDDSSSGQEWAEMLRKRSQIELEALITAGMTRTDINRGIWLKKIDGFELKAVTLATLASIAALLLNN